MPPEHASIADAAEAQAGRPTVETGSAEAAVAPLAVSATVTRPALWTPPTPSIVAPPVPPFVPPTQAQVFAAVGRVVGRSSGPQAVKGLLTAGLGRAALYALNKALKHFRA